MGFSTYLLAIISLIFLSIPTFYLLANLTNNRLFSFLARSIASFTALILCACYGVVASIVLRLAGKGGLSQWTVARAFKWTMWLTTGVTFEVVDTTGALKTRPAVFVGNHQTELDVLVLGCMFPPYCSVTSKTSLKWYPILGWFMTLSKTVFINRSSSKDARAAFATAVETMHSDGQSVFIFPEGTRSYSSKPEMLPFKKGAFHLAVQAQVPIVPVVVANYSNILDVKRKVFNSGTIPLSILKPFETKGMGKEDVEGLAQKVRKAMEEELVRISIKAKDRGVAIPGQQAMGFADGSLKSSGVDVSRAG